MAGSMMSTPCAFLHGHCYKILLLALAGFVALEYCFGLLNEESRRMSEAYFTFNLTLPASRTVLHYSSNNNNEKDDYYATVNMTAVGIESVTSKDPYTLYKPVDPHYGATNGSATNSTRILPVCPIVSPLLVGRTNVSKEAPPLSSFEDRYAKVLQPGGRYRPPDCEARCKVAIVIPFRDRDEHLRLFLYHMHPFLQRQQIDYGIFVVEQSGNSPFNRAMLMNIGAAEALRQDQFQCFIFHDIDLLPEDDRNIYSCPEQPRHMSVAIDIFKHKLPYLDLFGGVSALTTEHFVKVNGFSNSFWGWGGEDDDMANRIKFNKLIISRYPASIARYTMLSHKKAPPNPKRYRLLRESIKRLKVDGLNSLKYKRLNLQLRKLYVHILVDIHETK